MRLGHRTTSRRAAALRLAREAKAKRDADRLLREQRIEAALADFFESSGRAEQIRSEAAHRVKKIIDDAEQEAGQADATAGEAIRALRELDQTNAEIGELCGLSVPVVRAMANRAPGGEAADDQPDDQPDGDRDNAEVGRVPGGQAAAVMEPEDTAGHEAGLMEQPNETDTETDGETESGNA